MWVQPFLIIGLLGDSGAISILFDILGVTVILFGLLSRSIGRRNHRRKGSDSLAIYNEVLHYWNNHFYHTPSSPGTRTTTPSWEKEQIFDATGNEKVRIRNAYSVPNLVKGSLTDTISYVHKQNKNIYKSIENPDIGILWCLAMPEVKTIHADTMDNFYLVPSGKVPKRSFYSFYTTREGYDVYVTGDPPIKLLDHILELIRPFTERKWSVGIEYTESLMYVYLPEFLPNIENITKEAELLHVCRRVDSFYYFLKRSFIWRYGNIEKWDQGERYD